MEKVRIGTIEKMMKKGRFADIQRNKTMLVKMLKMFKIEQNKIKIQKNTKKK